MMFSRGGRLKLLVPVVLALSIAIAHANFVETLVTAVMRRLAFDRQPPTGVFRSRGAAAIPQLIYTGRYSRRFRFGTCRSGRPPPISWGNYYAQQIGGISLDLNIFSGTEAPNRVVISIC